MTNTIKDKVIKGRKENKTEDKIEKIKMNGLEISKESANYVNKAKKELIENSKILKKEISKYIDKNIKFYEELTRKITEALTYNNFYEFYFNDKCYKKVIKKEKQYGWVMTEWVSAKEQMECSNIWLQDYIYEVKNAVDKHKDKVNKFIKKDKFGGRCKYSFGYRNSLPYGEDYYTYIKFTHKYYKVSYLQSHDEEPDHIENSDECVITFDKDKLIKYLNKEGLVVKELKDNKLEVKLNEN